MDLFFEDTNRQDELTETSSRKSKYNRKRCLLNKESTTINYSAKVAKTEIYESADESDYGGD